MTLAPGEQRMLLRMERSLRKDPGLSAALYVFDCQWYRGGDPGNETMSPWRPVLWRVELLGLIVLTLAFVGTIAALACLAL